MAIYKVKATVTISVDIEKEVEIVRHYPWEPETLTDRDKEHLLSEDEMAKLVNKVSASEIQNISSDQYAFDYEVSDITLVKP